MARARQHLAERGICWHPIVYHRRTNLLAAAFDGAVAFGTAVATILRHRIRIVHTRTSVPGIIGLAAARIAGRAFLYDADNELSQEYADAGHWRRDSIAFRLLAYLESACRRHADAVVVLTERLKSDFVRRGVRAPIAVIPCCVDVTRFQFDESRRRERRLELGLDSEPLLIYIGKTGPKYLVAETMRFARSVQERTGAVRVLVLTHDDAAFFTNAAIQEGLDPALVIVRRAAPDEVPGWLSAADAGIALIKTTDSERGTSPIKTSEYLAAGLPIVLTPSIGDLSAVVESNRLGVVVTEQSPAAIDAAVAALQTLWAEPALTRARCAAWARSGLDLESVAAVRYEQTYKALMS